MIELERNMVPDFPTFFNMDEEITNSGYEAMQDFFLSWTFRCAIEKYRNVNPKVHEYSKRIVHAIIFGANDDTKTYELKEPRSDDFNVISVKTIRQWKYIDLIAEINYTLNAQQRRVILNIENKWYSRLTKEQLERSKIHVGEKYVGAEAIVHAVIFCDYEKIEQPTFDLCRGNDFKVIAIPDLQLISRMQEEGPTSYELFDEYWIKDWRR